MRHFEQNSFSRVLAVVLAGFLTVFLLGPISAGAKLDVAIDPGAGGEGDPLDSNDYSSGGGSSSDTDIHEDAAAPVEDGLLRIIRTLIVDQTGALIVPFFQGGVPVLQIVPLADRDLGAVPHAN